jgi:uncharacterized protein YutE (UPF0331/DUF86 family)
MLWTNLNPHRRGHAGVTRCQRRRSLTERVDALIDIAARRADASRGSGDDGVSKVLDELEQHVVVDGERHYRLVHFAAFLEQPERALKHLSWARQR